MRVASSSYIHQGGLPNKVRFEQRPVGIERRQPAETWKKFLRLRACDGVQETAHQLLCPRLGEQGEG